MDLKPLRENKVLVTLIAAFSLIVITTVFKSDDILHTEPSDPIYTGTWSALHNSSKADVSIKDKESYDIRYSNSVCNIVFLGTIYTIDIEHNPYKILKLDIDKAQSECYYLNTFFAPSKFVFKMETLTPGYTKLRLPTIKDLELYLEYADGSDAMKRNVESMITLLKSKSTMLQKMENVVLEYEKK